MKDTLARNLARFRKEKGYTQEELARQLGISSQAVSKWETGHSLPDITLLPALAELLETGTDALLGYQSGRTAVSIYEDAYRITKDYYWGTVPNAICYRVLETMPPDRRLRLLDIGCGEGRDSVFFARNGYDVTAFDISEAGVEKTRKLAVAAGVPLRVFRADIRDFRLEEPFDILFSSGVFNYIPPDLRQEILGNYREHTRPGGLHVFNAFVEKPFIGPPPEKEDNAHPWYSGELIRHYRDWQIHESNEIIFDCNSMGIPHQHAMVQMIAEKVL